MRYSLLTLFIVLSVAAVLSLVIAPYFQDDISPDIKYLEGQGFAVTSFRDANGRAYLTSIRAVDRVIQEFDVEVIGKQLKIGLMQLKNCRFEAKELQQMLTQPELSHLQLDGVPLSPAMLEIIQTKSSLLGLDISGTNLSESNFQALCKIPNLCLLRLSDISRAQFPILQSLAQRYPQIKIFCNDENLPLPDSATK